jgi:hypothetical protein
MSIFFSPIEKIQTVSVQLNPNTNNYAITTSAVKRTKKATEAVAKTLFTSYPSTPVNTTRFLSAPPVPPSTPEVSFTKSVDRSFLLNTPFVSPIACVSPISLVLEPSKQDDPFITPVHQLRSQKDPDTPRPLRKRSVSVYMTPLKL